jgi:hypothetical protein
MEVAMGPQAQAALLQPTREAEAEAALLLVEVLGAPV